MDPPLLCQSQSGPAVITPVEAREYYRSVLHLVLVAAGAGRYGSAWVVECALAEICLESCRVGPVHVSVTKKIAVTGILVAWRDCEKGPAKVRLKGCRISSVSIPVAVEIRFTLAGISYTVAIRRIGIFLGSAAIAVCPAITMDCTHTQPIYDRRPSRAAAKLGTVWFLGTVIRSGAKGAGFTCIAYTIAIIIPLASSTDGSCGIAGTTI